MGLIYQATNKINGKSYVGQTKFTIEERQLTHIANSKKSKSYFHKAVRKYGFENFKWETLYTCEDKYLDFMEEFFIRAFNTFESGYNLTTGGEGGYIRSEKTKKLISEAAKKRTGKKNPFYGKNHSKKTKQLLSIKCKENANPGSFWKGKKMSKEHRKNIGLGQVGEKNGFFGKSHSQETRQKIREARLGSTHSIENRRKMSEAHKRRNKK